MTFFLFFVYASTKNRYQTFDYEPVNFQKVTRNFLRTSIGYKHVANMGSCQERTERVALLPGPEIKA